MPISPEELQDTHLFEKAIWRLLARGAVDAKHAYFLGEAPIKVNSCCQLISLFW
jgi:hypothetical protein